MQDILEKGQVKERISEHLGQIPGGKVQIEQFSSISEAQRKEVNVIKRPRQNITSKGSKVLPKRFEEIWRLISRAIAGPRGPKKAWGRR